jgi:ferredoxin
MPELRVADHDAVVLLRPDETILAGLNRAGYTARVGCKRGGCGVCKVNLTSGETSYRTTVASTVVTDDERSEGVVLICRAVPEGEITIALPEGFKFGRISEHLAMLARP